MDNLSVEDKKKLATELTTPPHVLEALSKEKEWVLRYRVAWNLNAPTHVLEALSKDTDRDVRSNVANNLNTPPRVLETLSNDEDWEVRASVAWNKNTLPILVEELVNDVDALVRFAALTTINPSLPLNIIKNLAVSNEEYDDKKFYSIMKNYYFTPLHLIKELKILTS